ncbi:uncharacterized protein LOC131245285 isoform X2 [Magnolia sinica]|uniref:uncharacterized protein LOC131245285 isoform X2 n=1 Tax=Magnolia sinica TaxID=86752 RepID=UPI002658DCFA|nr:uncharacterized protein LOC131245285 isoform X2 [Magnolia sinica]
MRFSQTMPFSRNRLNMSPQQSRMPEAHPNRLRTRKKHKRLDAIRDHVIEPIKPDVGAAGPSSSDSGLLRRSSRLRRVTRVVSDPSPSPVKKQQKVNKTVPAATTDVKKKNEGSVDRKAGKRKRESPSEKIFESPVSGGLEETGNWSSRLRSRARNVRIPMKEKGSPAKRKLFQDLDGFREEDTKSDGGVGGSVSLGTKFRRMDQGKKSKGAKSGDQITGLSDTGGDSSDCPLKEWLSPTKDEAPPPSNNVIDGGSKRAADDSSLKRIDGEDNKTACDLLATGQGNDQLKLPGCELANEKMDANEGNSNHLNTLENDGCHDDVDAHHDHLGSKPLEDNVVRKVDESNPVSEGNKFERPRVREGRRCGLCGGGMDGKPPKRLVRDFIESDNEVYGGSSASEEPNYDVWDGFGDESSWLGRLLGPTHDRFGIAGVWVHQHCAVWSPEVYFAGLGCLKNVRAALCRGRALKCSRCGRPGATIGCRVDRCPKTYHLPCARAEGCIFDHRKFLIACTDHRHLFQPQGNDYLRRIKKLKARKMKFDMRKLSTDAWRKDVEAEEKWLENCGEDEEFLRREGKRLHRDISRIAPVYIGGSSSDSEKSYQGWESVAGLKDVIQCMKEVVILPLLYPEFFSNLGLTPPRGVLLHGYPGTGKTLVVRALIGACSRGDKRIAYFARKGADCLGKYVGDAERQLRLLFQVAERSQPSIIFFDEIDGLAPCRSRQQDQTHSSVVSTLLALLDGLKSRGSVIVIGATNRPEAIDPALRRPGRFDREIYFPLPSVNDRSAILSLHTQRWPKPISGSLLKWIAEQTGGFAGADLQALCTQAAMIALKRNCALQELLSAAEKYPNHGKRVSLPSFVVEERDWLAALACVPPPCSRREAGMAANDVVSSPLQAHLVPCLLQPISHLLISLYLDERIQLPPSLYKAAKLTNSVVISALEQKKIPVVSWSTHLHCLIQEPDVSRELERNLSRAGLLSSTSSFSNSDLLDDDCGGHEKFEFGRLNPAGAHGRSSLIQNLSHSQGNASGFRLLITGSPRSGQQHLAACLLHGFAGHVELQKVNLATISQEGRGDLVQGITRILLKCLSAGRCMIYMPRIDLWAMDHIWHHATDKECDICQKTCKSTVTPGFCDVNGKASQAWNSFMEQVDSLCTSASLMILATCDMPKHVVPLRIRKFFTTDVLNYTNSTPSEQTIPRYLLQVDGKFNRDMVLDSSAAKLSRDLVQLYVQLIHQRGHMGNSCKEFKTCESMKSNSKVENHMKENGANSEVKETSMDSERVTVQESVSCNGNQIPMVSKTNLPEDAVWPESCKNSVSRIPPNRNVKGKSNLLFAIATFGYQILRYPHFAELCWATSKLKEGPCTSINGRWKGWPFNSCVVRPTNSVEKEAVGCSSNLKSREHSGAVRGLVAVGLLAYKGVYTSVREVSSEVRKVLELLVGQINMKIQGGKDRYRFLRLLSQVAYMEDMVDSWAYGLRSFETESQISASHARPAIAGRLDTDDNNACSSNLVKKDACVPSVSNQTQQEVEMLGQEKCPMRHSNKDSEFGDPNKGDTHLDLPKSDVSLVIAGPSQEVSLGPSSPRLLQKSALVAGSVASNNTSKEMHKTNNLEPCRSEDQVPCTAVHRGFVSLKQSNGLAVALPPMDGISNADESAVIIDPKCRKGGDQCNGLSATEAVLPSINGDCSHAEAVRAINSDVREDSSLSAIPGLSCLYECCAECLRTIEVLIREILIDSWESNSCCSSVGDVHDVVIACSVKLLVAVRNFFVAESSTDEEDLCCRKLKHGTQDKHCACQYVSNIHPEKLPCWSKSLGNRDAIPMECVCHLKNKEVTAATNSSQDSLFGPGLKLFFRDCALVPSDLYNDVIFHCKFENLCICHIIERILMIKQPVD